MKSKTEKPGAGGKRATPARFTGKNKPFPKKPFVKRNPFAKTDAGDKPRAALPTTKDKPFAKNRPSAERKPFAKQKSFAKDQPLTKDAPVVRPYGSGARATARPAREAPVPRGPGAPFVSHKPELVARLAIVRERGYLYFVRTTDVCRAPMRRAGEIETVVVGKFTREPGYIYMLNEHGDVVRSKL